MVFGYTIEGRAPLNPAMKRYDEAFRLEDVWGTLNFDTVTSGDVALDCDNVLHCAVTIAEGARVPIVTYDTPAAGTVRLSGVTSNDTGRFRALVAHRKH